MALTATPQNLGWVSHLWFGSGFEKFPLKIPNFSIFSPLGHKISSVWVKNYPVQRWVSLLFTAGQKYAQVRLGWVRAHLYSKPRYEIYKH